MGHPFNPSFLLVLSLDKGTKCLNRLADVYHNFLRASRVVVIVVVIVVVTAIATASHVERNSSPFLGPLWLYNSMSLTSRATIRF